MKPLALPRHVYHLAEDVNWPSIQHRGLLCARRRPACRGWATFVPYLAWIESGWASEAQTAGRRDPRSRRHPPAELTVMDAVPDVMDFVVAVKALEPGTEFRPPAGTKGSGPLD